MKYEARESRLAGGGWRVDTLREDGFLMGRAVFFVGDDAEARAREYACWKNSQEETLKALEILYGKPTPLAPPFPGNPIKDLIEKRPRVELTGEAAEAKNWFMSHPHDPDSFDIPGMTVKPAVPPAPENPFYPEKP